MSADTLCSGINVFEPGKKRRDRQGGGEDNDDDDDEFGDVDNPMLRNILRQAYIHLFFFCFAERLTLCVLGEREVRRNRVRKHPPRVNSIATLTDKISMMKKRMLVPWKR